MLKTILPFILNFACDESSKDNDTAEIEDTNNQEVEDTQTEDTDTEDTDDSEQIEPNADYVVDSSDSTTWIYFSLDTGAIVTPEVPEDSTEWDLKFQRYVIGINGGVNGTAGVQVMVQEGTYDTYSDISSLPSDGVWITDEEDAAGNPEA